MNRHTGAALDRFQHIAQSIEDILTTRVGTRIARREYGSLLPELIDHPQNDATRLRLYAATAMALMRWEPRIRLARVQLDNNSLDGHAELTLTGVLVDHNQPFNLRMPLQLGGAA
ncbi:GPW/gp25 family protein [Pseudomonas fulva]|uniref:GPW/gp25 family protein n=1 Tax=Pseudomonas fulva TaxID=47880 RepID=UPI000D91448E|nr:GPW/gp25 family protein [Pseudomonas fulva]PYB93576.1 baseplate assembly protein [Pseudomonas fulva]PYC16401.1 baseplate assembly protein [Pseudomonas fulva]